MFAGSWELGAAAACVGAEAGQRRCRLATVVMMDSEGVKGDDEGQVVDNDEFQALRKEVLSLREAQKQQSQSESSLILELQRRCDRVIELEVGYTRAMRSG